MLKIQKDEINSKVEDTQKLKEQNRKLQGRITQIAKNFDK